MKKFLIIPIIIIFLIVTTFTLAAEDNEDNEVTVTPTPASSSEEAEEEETPDKVKTLKDKLATKVAQLREDQKRGFFGEIDSLSKESFTLVTGSAEVKIRYTDIVKIVKLGSKNKELEIDDLEDKQSASVLGVYDEKTKTVSAKLILIHNYPQHFSGEIITIDRESAEINIKTAREDGTITISYERTTKAQEYGQKSEANKKSGFSKLKAGDWIEVWGDPDEDDSNLILAKSIYRLPSDLIEKEGEEEIEEESEIEEEEEKEEEEIISEEETEEEE